MSGRFDRFFNPKDGTYANVPIIAVHPEKYRGKRTFGTKVLIGNWYEDRTKFKESPHRSRSFYRLEYPAHVGSVPDTVLRRKVVGTQEDRPARQILEHHDIDDQKQLISSYDEGYSRRGPYGEFRDTSERKWALQDDYWLPERSDHPLEGPPTSWGLLERKRAQSQCLQRQRITPEISEYSDRYVPYRPEVYSSSRRTDIPRITTTAIDRSNSFTTHLATRSISDCTRPIVTIPDPMELDHVQSSRRNSRIPRAYFYLGNMPNHLRKTLPNVTQSTNLTTPLTASTEQFISVD